MLYYVNRHVNPGKQVSPLHGPKIVGLNEKPVVPRNWRHWIAWLWPYVQMLGRGRIRDLTETRTGNAPRHGQDENLMMLKLRSRPMVRTINCAVNLSVYPEPWPASLPKWGLWQVSALNIGFAIVSNSPPDKGTSAALLLFDINAQSANRNTTYPLNTDVWSAKSCLQRNASGAPDRLVIRAQWVAERWKRTSEE